MKTVIMIGSDLHDETIETGLSHSFHALVVEIPGDQPLQCLHSHSLSDSSKLEPSV